MTQSVFAHQDMQMSYLAWGEGPDLILCFHGFGRSAADFQLLVDCLMPHQRLVAVDLYAHGLSGPMDAQAPQTILEKGAWIEFMKAFLQHLKVSECHILAYSMGGRVALCMWQWMPEYVKSLLLMAPDGLKKNYFSAFTSGTALGRSMFRYLIKKPESLFAVADFLHRIRLIHTKLFRFVHVHFDTESKRQLVYDAWLAYGQFTPDISLIAQIHYQDPIPVHLVFGANDSVIRKELGDKAKRHFRSPIQLLVMESGHRMMNPQLVTFIADHDLWPKA